MNTFCRWTAFIIVIGSILVFSSCGEAKPDIGAWIDEQLEKAREKARESEEEDDPSDVDDKSITGFRFPFIEGETVAIDQANKKIHVVLPEGFFGTDLTAFPILPEVIHTGASYEPTEPQIFSPPKIYTVTGLSGETQSYLVDIAIAEADSDIMISGKQVTETPTELITITVTENYYNVKFTLKDGSPCSGSSLNRYGVPLDRKAIFDGISGNVAVAIVGDSGNVETPFRLQLKNVNLDVTHVVAGDPLPAIGLKGDSSGIYPNVELIVEGINSAVSNGISTDGKYRTNAGIFVPADSKINIHGTTGSASANYLTAKGNISITTSDYDQDHGAGIGGYKCATASGVAGSITIGSGVTVKAYGAGGAAGIGGGNNVYAPALDESDEIIIEDNAVVYAYGIGGGPGIGIGKGSYPSPSSALSIKIRGGAYVYASGHGGGSVEGAGIGFGGDTNVHEDKAAAEIEISGNTRVFAQGGNGAAGIGTGNSNYYDTVRNLTVTIGSGSDNPIVASVGGSAISGRYPVAIGYASDEADIYEASDINITVHSGFVIAVADTSASQIIGKSSNVFDSVTVTTKINGGSVWLNKFASDCINPVPRNAGGNPIYPLYLPRVYGGTDFWLETIAKEVTVPSANYKAKTADAKVKAFIDSLFGAGSIPANAMDIAAVLWVPSQLYADNISVGGIAASADVTPSFVEYSSTLTTNVINP
ncbi:MAG: hypothetical protein Ta2F_15410 [Termitinemataceae bacterium]|nr:MAG: hypothetical protein Ta2F_15410 [Termitinemataceae bacterium]